MIRILSFRCGKCSKILEIDIHNKDNDNYYSVEFSKDGTIYKTKCPWCGTEMNRIIPNK